MNALQLLQSKAGVEPDGKFGKNTFKAASKYLGLSELEAVHFFAQCAHETGNFTTFEENLNYSADGLRTVFKKYFTPEQAAKYARQPARIANRVYANRMGNSDESTGDGWKFRGRGAIQLTGYDNYSHLATTVGDIAVVFNPEIVSTKYAFESATLFFSQNNLWPICRQGIGEDVIRKVTKAVNGGFNGLEHRIELTYTYHTYLG
jgi:putative chitinase